MKANESVHPVYNSVLYHNRGLLKWEQLAMDIYSSNISVTRTGDEEQKELAKLSIKASKIFFEELDKTK